MMTKEMERIVVKEAEEEVEEEVLIINTTSQKAATQIRRNMQQRIDCSLMNIMLINKENIWIIEYKEKNIV